ncbi:hypothetical protein ABTX15_28365 [Micromonospora sp. NPDC094482]|uniref:hypothetical protein n=1 Tax=Micromonospora sp. NPDC094482 TaxID=3155081 RepID=UPI0033279B4C
MASLSGDKDEADLRPGRPVWLLDVDGVVNATRPGWGGPPRKSQVWSDTDRVSYVVRWALALVDRIRALQESGGVDIRWCSTWCPDAHRLEYLWRLPPLARAITADPIPRGPACWPLKLAAARAVLAEGRRLVWTDDEALPPPGRLRDELTAGGQALLIEPRSKRGLQPEDLDRIEAFVAASQP